MAMRRKYTDEEKRAGVDAYYTRGKQGGFSVNGFAAELGVPPASLRNWLAHPRYNPRLGKTVPPKKSTKGIPMPAYSDEFKQKQVAEFRASGITSPVVFAKGRGFSEAALRKWITDPRYNTPPVVPFEPPVNERPAPEDSSVIENKLTAIIGRLVVRLWEVDPNFTL